MVLISKWNSFTLFTSLTTRYPWEVYLFNKSPIPEEELEKIMKRRGKGDEISEIQMEIEKHAAKRKHTAAGTSKKTRARAHQKLEQDSIFLTLMFNIFFKFFSFGRIWNFTFYVLYKVFFFVRDRIINTIRCIFAN